MAPAPCPSLPQVRALLQRQWLGCTTSLLRRMLPAALAASVPCIDGDWILVALRMAPLVLVCLADTTIAYNVSGVWNGWPGSCPWWLRDGALWAGVGVGVGSGGYCAGMAMPARMRHAVCGVEGVACGRMRTFGTCSRKHGASSARSTNPPYKHTSLACAPDPLPAPALAPQPLPPPCTTPPPHRW